MPNRASVFSEDDQIRALAVIGKLSRYPERDAALFALSHFAGLRVGEIADLDVDDLLDRDGKIKSVIILTRTKMGRVREAFIGSQPLVLALQRYVDIRSLSGAHIFRENSSRRPLFMSKNRRPFTSVTLSQLFARLYQDWLKLDGAKSHSGRRTFITRLADKGYNLKHIAVLAGHASVQTTAIYVESNPILLSQMASSAASNKVARFLSSGK